VAVLRRHKPPLTKIAIPRSRSASRFIVYLDSLSVLLPLILSACVDRLLARRGCGGSDYCNLCPAPLHSLIFLYDVTAPDYLAGKLSEAGAGLSPDQAQTTKVP
jgi:hypothetical protein